MTYFSRPGPKLNLLAKRGLAKLDVSIITECGALARRPDRKLRVDPVFVLARMLLERPFSLLQIGAFDGQKNDFVRGVLGSGRVQATLVEPEPDAFEALQRGLGDHPQVQLRNLAVAAQGGQIDFYRVKSEHRGLDPNCHQYSGLSPLVIRKQMSHLVPDVEELIERIRVPAQTYAELIADLGDPPPDVVLIDTEGFDAEVVSQVLRQRPLPEIIVFEIRHIERAELWHVYESLFEAEYKLHECFPDAVAVRARLAESWISQL